MDYALTNKLIKETEDLGRQATLRHVIAKAYEAGQASMGADITPYGKLLADIQKRIKGMETYISYESLSDFGFGFNVDKDKIIKKLNSEGGFTATADYGPMNQSCIFISY